MKSLITKKPSGVETIKAALERRNWHTAGIEVLDEFQRRFLESPAEATWKRFLFAIQPIRAETFQRFCEILEISWEEIADQARSRSKNRDRLPFEPSSAFFLDEPQN